MFVLSRNRISQGREKYTPPPWRPSFFSFSGSEALWCIPFFPDLWCTLVSLVSPGKWYTPLLFLLCDLGVGRQTEKRGVPQWWCILLFPLYH